MNYKEMRYVVPPDPPKEKIITPGEIYSASVLEDIPNIIGDIWEIIDFRPLKKEDTKWIASWGEIITYGPVEDRPGNPRFILKRKITNEDRLAWLLEHYNRSLYCVNTPLTVEEIDRMLRKGKERKK